jgi:hypothetical protein
MIAWGVAMPLVGSPIENQDGWALALQLGLFSGVFESIQVMRNADETLWTRVLGGRRSVDWAFGVTLPDMRAMRRSA